MQSTIDFFNCYYCWPCLSERSLWARRFSTEAWGAQFYHLPTFKSQAYNDLTDNSTMSSATIDTGTMTAEHQGDSILHVPDRPKRPMSAYNLFFKDERRKMVDGDKVEGFSNMARTIGAKWKVLDPEVREYYEELGRQALVAHKKRMSEWKRLAKMAKKLTADGKTKLVPHSASSSKVTDASVVSFEVSNGSDPSTAEGTSNNDIADLPFEPLQDEEVPLFFDKSSDCTTMTSFARFTLQSNLGALSDRLGPENVNDFVGLFSQY